MPIIIGNDNLSDEQRDSLERYGAGTGRRSPPLTRILVRLLEREDISTGREELSWEWISNLEGGRERLEYSRDSTIREDLIKIDEALNKSDLTDSLVNTIKFANQKVAFLLGAGASKPSPSCIPTVMELLESLLQRARRIDREQINSLIHACNDQGITNIEDLLTAVYIMDFYSRNPRVLDLIQSQMFVDTRRPGFPRYPGAGTQYATVSSAAYLQDTLQVLFGLLSNLMLPARPNSGHESIASYVRNNDDSSIITTNYDCCMDLALLGNGSEPGYTIKFSNYHSESSSKAVPLIKLHGSLNWFYCQTCQNVSLMQIKEAFKDFADRKSEYPIISVCADCGDQRRGLLVPPNAMKFDVASPLQSLIGEAAGKFETATLIIVVGFSFSEADAYISRMISKAMLDNEKARMIVVDPDYRVAARLRRKFSVLSPGFDVNYRILRLHGDCSKTLPTFLSLCQQVG